MGSSFIAYGALLAVMLLLGQEWLVRRNKSQEFFDSAMIGAWGYILLVFILTLDWSIRLRNIDGDLTGLIKTFNILLWV